VSPGPRALLQISRALRDQSWLSIRAEYNQIIFTHRPPKINRYLADRAALDSVTNSSRAAIAEQATESAISCDQLLRD